jgi:ferredoxin--NADP+ reductase
VTKGFDRVAADPRVRFFGGVEFGRDLSLHDLVARYHQVLVSTGAQSDRRMGIPGEDLRGSHAAREFVAWYNGHPDYAARQFDLDATGVAVVGVGNVALDVARILCLPGDALGATDMADHAIDALSRSAVRDVYVLGRRGPAQATFTVPELRELADLDAVDVIVRPDEARLDDASALAVEQSGDRLLRRKVDIIQELAARAPAGRPRRVHLRFCVSPVAVLDDGGGRVGGLRVERNRLVQSEAGTILAAPTGEQEDLAVGLVFRAVGYRGVPLPGLPFDARLGVVPNERGRVIDPATHEHLTGLYTAGWIKRGPTGVIGTNKVDAAETVAHMLEDAAAGRVLAPSADDGIAALLARRNIRFVTYDDWRTLDELELARGRASGRPRVKFTSVEEMLAALAAPLA